MQDFYIKSRRTYLLVAATLIIWEYFDLRITSIPGLKTNLTDGQIALVPSFLALICFYMAYRVTIDWLFFAPSKSASRIDFVVVHSIGLGSLFAYLLSRFYPTVEVQFLGIYLGQSVAMFLCLFIFSFSSKSLQKIPESRFMKPLRKKQFSLIFWGIALIISLIQVAFFLMLKKLNLISLITGFIGFIIFWPAIWLVIRIPRFISDSDEGDIVSRIGKAFDAERELAKIKSKRHN